MSYLNVKNRASSTLASGILAADLSLTVATGEGALFPATSFNVTIGAEILFCSSRTGDVLTVVRAQEGTTAADALAGDVVELRITAGVIENLERGAGQINVEVLSADKTLVAGVDEMYQYLDPNGADRLIILDTAGAKVGDRFVIKNTVSDISAYYLRLDNAGGINLDFVYTHGVKNFIFDGINWVNTINGTNTGALAIGYNSNAYQSGLAYGNSSYARSYGVAVGNYSNAYNAGVSLGNNSSGQNFGVALGYKANTALMYYSIALGQQSLCSRFGETAVAIDNDTDSKRQVIQGRLTVQTIDATATEIITGGWIGVFTIRPSSHFAFKGIVIARNDAGNEGMSWKIEGMIKRDALSNTALVGTPTVTEIAKDGTLAWSVAITADDVNEALILTVTGEAAKTIRWAAVLDGIEVIV